MLDAAGVKNEKALRALPIEQQVAAYLKTQNAQNTLTKHIVKEPSNQAPLETFEAKASNHDVARRRAIVSLSEQQHALPESEWLSEGVFAQVIQERTKQFLHQPRILIRGRESEVLNTRASGLTADEVDFLTHGMTMDGKIYLFRDAHANTAEIVQTLWHELVHYGLRRFLTKEQYIEEMHTLYQRDAWVKSETNKWLSTNSSDVQAAKKRGKDYALARGVDEALAKLAETNEGEYRNNSLKAKATREVARWIAAMAERFGFHEFAAKYRGVSNDEARALVRSLFQKMKEDAPATTNDPAFFADPAFMVRSNALPKGWVNGDGETAAAMWRGENKAEGVLLGQVEGKLLTDLPELAGFSHSVNRSALLHIKKEHGDDGKESSRGQLAITDKEIYRIPEIIRSYNALRTDLKNSYGNQVIAYAKKMDNGVVVYMEEVRNKRRDLSALSMRWYPTATDAQKILKSSAVSLNVQNDGRHEPIIKQSNASFNQSTTQTHAITIDGIAHTPATAPLDSPSEAPRESTSQSPSEAPSKQTTKEAPANRSWINKDIGFLMRRKSAAREIGKQPEHAALIQLARRYLNGETVTPDDFRAYTQHFKIAPELNAALHRIMTKVEAAETAKTRDATHLTVGERTYDRHAPEFGLEPFPKTLPDDHPLLQDTSRINTPERQAWRNGVIKQYFVGKTPATERKPIAYLMGGGGASGKGTILGSLIDKGTIKTEHAITIDPDKIKEIIPEYTQLLEHGDYRAADVVHKESYQLAEQIRERAIKEGYDLILDTTLGSLKSGLSLLNKLKASGSGGYTVHLFGVTIEPELAVIRADERARKKGRFVPIPALLKAHKGFAQAFEQYTQIADTAELYDNSEKNRRLLAKANAGELSVINRTAYNHFIERSHLNEQANTLWEIENNRRSQPTR